MSRLAHIVTDNPEALHEVIDAAEQLAVIVRDLLNGWAVRELHKRPDLALRQLRSSLKSIGVSEDELSEIFESYGK